MWALVSQEVYPLSKEVRRVVYVQGKRWLCFSILNHLHRWAALFLSFGKRRMCFIILDHLHGWAANWWSLYLGWASNVWYFIPIFNILIIRMNFWSSAAWNMCFLFSSASITVLVFHHQQASVQGFRFACERGNTSSLCRDHYAWEWPLEGRLKSDWHFCWLVAQAESASP